MIASPPQIIQQGDENGNGMIARFQLASGRDIFGCATRNAYGAAWDVGPTWNYLVTGDRLFLVDSGRRGMGSPLLEMIEATGFAASDLAHIVLSHGHEDHDGGLFELSKLTQAQICAHPVYGMLNRVEPSMAPAEDKRDMPASCWHCPMPKWFADKFCPAYHEERKGLAATYIRDSRHPLGSGVRVMHLPGHSPDAVTLVIDDEAVLVGDTILPEITPHPSREQFFELTRGMLDSEYVEAQQLYGLRTYIRSLKQLRNLAGNQVHTMVLPGHRLFSKSDWNQLDLADRADELVEHHVQRCFAILDLLSHGPLAPEDMATKYFEASLLEGFGMHLALNEILSHCELMEIAGDVSLADNGRFVATGSRRFESLIRELG